MPRRRAKKVAKPAPEEPEPEPEPEPCLDDSLRDDVEVQRQIVALKAIVQLENDHILTALRLLRSYLSEEQLQTPVLQFFNENCPNISIIENGESGQFEMKFNGGGGGFDGRDIHLSLLNRMSLCYPFPFAAAELASEGGRPSMMSCDSLMLNNLVFDGPSESQMLRVHDALRTPGVTSQRLSIGTTPKTRRLPKPGEMLLSVHGSPLGVYKEDNMEAINETEEGSTG